MLRRKLGPRMNDLRRLKVGPMPTWFRELNLMATERARTRRPSQACHCFQEEEAILCVVVLIIEKRSVHTTKKESLH
jgi:hypothetical protein